MRKGVKENIIITGLTGATLLSGAFLTLPRVSAEPNTETVDRITITVPSSCSLSSTVDNPTHTATVHNREYVEDIGETTIKAVCNDINGFSIYAIGFSDDTYGKTVLSASTVDHINDIVTGIATEGDTSNWAMRLSSVSGTYAPTIENGFDEYSEVPATYTKVATFASRTDQSLGSSLKTNYAVYVSGTQLADTYTGKVKYTMVHPSTNDTNSFVVNFFANGGAGTMSSQKISRGVATALSANTFTAPSGLGFAGWNTKLDGSGTTYANSASVTNLADAGETVNLYAMWQEAMTFNKAYAAAGKTQSGGYYIMQDATTSICSAVDEGQVGEVKDGRDGTIYHIGKLADGKCWLLDNLALDLTKSAVLSGMTQDNTNASNTTLGYLKGTTSRNPSTYVNGKYATAGVSNWTSGYSYSAPLVNMTSKDVVPTSFYGPDDPMKDAVVAGNWKVGGYYNYCAATAGSYCYGDGTSEGTSYGNATEDICPAGWRMPTGNTSGKYQVLYNNSNYNTCANYRSALRLPLSGEFLQGWAAYYGDVGRWWSSTRYDNYYMYSLDVFPSNISSAVYHDRADGHSVRCVLGS